jgi:hypothetical protein
MIFLLVTVLLAGPSGRMTPPPSFEYEECWADGCEKTEVKGSAQAADL